jgi:peptidoglycan/xylan/chitin deacetylase (PgdA/CDA1 family)
LRIRKLILGYAVAALFGSIVLVASGHWIAAIVLLFSSHAPILYATLSPYSQWWGRVVRRFETSEREVWITIDDGPSEHSVAMGELLAEKAARATFFVVGQKVARNVEKVRDLKALGHEIGNHSRSHPSGTFWCLPPHLVKREILKCSRVIEGTIAAKPTLFRPPVGMKNPFVHPVLESEQLELVGWSARGFDGVKVASAQSVVDRVMRDVTPGTIILLHEGRPHSIEILRLLLQQLERDGYRAVIPTASQLLPRKHEQVVIERRLEPERSNLA